MLSGKYSFPVAAEKRLFLNNSLGVPTEQYVTPRRRAPGARRELCGGAGALAGAAGVVPGPEARELAFDEGGDLLGPRELGAEDGETEEDDEPAGAGQRNHDEADDDDRAADEGHGHTIGGTRPRPLVEVGSQRAQELAQRLARVLADRDIPAHLLLPLVHCPKLTDARATVTGNSEPPRPSAGVAQLPHRFTPQQGGRDTATAQR